MNHIHQAYLNATKNIDILNASHDVKRALRESKVLNGLITVYAIGSTAGVAILENDPSVHEAFKELLASFVPAPESREYRHPSYFRWT